MNNRVIVKKVYIFIFKKNSYVCKVYCKNLKKSDQNFEK